MDWTALTSARRPRKTADFGFEAGETLTDLVLQCAEGGRTRAREFVI